MLIDQPNRPNRAILPLALLALRLSIGVIYLWFGIIKFFPGLSPAEHLVTGTFRVASFGLIGESISRPLVAVWEVLIGVIFLSGVCMRAGLLLLALQLIGAMAPLVLLPSSTWKQPFVLTMDGQFIMKDLVIIAASLALASQLHWSHRPSPPRG